ncbi:hypothetical protein DFJ58DRAFT_913452 [Suillus subalutaceus]|uniref:uncharacterized protein n=1 Tax=Suillus subalutaceus TaxID=48586 RepID=UPI001B86D27A|nr:uncharacterized protein DFJ58DRAFT_913452 [Suillus subalutaceus]KAG1857747.1 hypothetical protein DFJ58DRAFT_913452 [Suillus subalutaceus]
MLVNKLARTNSRVLEFDNCPQHNELHAASAYPLFYDPFLLFAVPFKRGHLTTHYKFGRGFLTRGLCLVPIPEILVRTGLLGEVSRTCRLPRACRHVRASDHPGALLSRQGRQEAIEALVGPGASSEGDGTHDVLPIDGRDEDSSIPPAILGEELHGINELEKDIGVRMLILQLRSHFKYQDAHGAHIWYSDGVTARELDVAIPSSLGIPDNEVNFANEWMTSAGRRMMMYSDNDTVARDEL